MNSEIYYHILEIGFIYEKGRQTDNRWHVGEKGLIQDECQLWKNLIYYASLEDKGVDCSDKAFGDLSAICKKHHLPNYETIIAKKNDLVESTNRYVLDEAKKSVLIDRMIELIKEIESCTTRINGKPEAYKALRQLHNIPRALHGADELGNGLPITFEEALKYAEK